MNNHGQISEILARILRTGLLRIRAQGAHGMAAQCSLEADHLHNLPDLILQPRLDLLRYYFNIERTAFLSEAANVEQFSEDWNSLKVVLDESSREETKDS